MEATRLMKVRLVRIPELMKSFSLDRVKIRIFEENLNFSEISCSDLQPSLPPPDPFLEVLVVVEFEQSRISTLRSFNPSL